MAYTKFKRGDWRIVGGAVIPVERDGFYRGRASLCPSDLRAKGHVMTRVRPGRVARMPECGSYRNSFHRSVWLYGDWAVEHPPKPVKVSERAPKDVINPADALKAMVDPIKNRQLRTYIDAMRAYCEADVQIGSTPCQPFASEGALFDLLRRRINSVYGKFPSGGPYRGHGTTQILSTPEEIMTRSYPFEILFDSSAVIRTSVPPFVEPDRPKTEPDVVPDTPSAAALRPLLADRERIQKNALAAVAGHERDIADHEARIAALKVDMAHKQAIAGKARSEVERTKEDIDRLNGMSRPDPNATGL